MTYSSLRAARVRPPCSRSGLGIWTSLAWSVALWLGAAAIDEVYAWERGVQDSGYSGRRSNAQDVYWIDNESAIFVGRRRSGAGADNGGADAKHWLHVWAVQTNVVQPVDEEGGSIRELCFNSIYAWEQKPRGVPVERGYVRYTFDRGGNTYKRFGRLFGEREALLDSRAIRGGVVSVNPISCREFNPRELRVGVVGDVIPLLRENEYLGFLRPNGATSISLQYFPSSGSPPKALAGIPYEAVLKAPRYSEYARKYVLQDLRATTGHDVLARVWLFDREGEVEALVVPPGPWAQGVLRGMPTRKGVFFTSTAVSNASVGAAGAYLAERGTVSKLLSGFPRSFAISPDGCRVVISIGSYDGEMAAPDIRLVQICSTGE